MFGGLAEFGCICFKGKVSIWIMPFFLENFFKFLETNGNDYIDAIKHTIKAFDNQRELSIDKELSNTCKSGVLVWVTRNRWGGITEYTGKSLRQHLGLL